MRLTLIAAVVSTALLAACDNPHAPRGNENAAHIVKQSSKHHAPPMAAEATDFDSAAMGTFARMNPAAANAAAKRSDHAPMTMMTREQIRQPENTERYADTPANPVQAVAQSPISTFGVDVDTGSYANVRRLLAVG